MIPFALAPCNICGAIGWHHRRSCVLWTPTDGEESRHSLLCEHLREENDWPSVGCVIVAACLIALAVGLVAANVKWWQ